MPISSFMYKSITKGSWIRKMFEEGSKLKKIHGNDAVMDFSLGNPILEPPKEFTEKAISLLQNEPGIHRYMGNSGYDGTKTKIANYLNKRDGLELTESDIVMTCGAGAALNVIMKAILDPGDEVMIISPYFVEYLFYIKNHGGVPVISESTPDFMIDVKDIEKRLNAKTRAVIINSPNNPTGVVYPEKLIKKLSDLLKKHVSKGGQRVYLITDEPYRKISYDNVEIPAVLKHYDHSIAVTSHSKDLGLAGERIGYIAINQNIKERDLYDALVIANRILGFVNAPSLMQRAVEDLQDVSVDINWYLQNRDLLLSILKEAGFNCIKPQGAFYIFPETPIEDDVKFVEMLQEELILAVPGSGFGRSGHIRLSYCVPPEVIEKSREGFKRIMLKARDIK